MNVFGILMAEGKKGLLRGALSSPTQRPPKNTDPDRSLQVGKTWTPRTPKPRATQPTANYGRVTLDTPLLS